MKDSFITIVFVHLRASVLVVGNESGFSRARTTGVLAELGLSVSLGVGKELGLGSGNILSLSLPGLEHGSLEGAAIGEGESPRTGSLKLVHGRQVQRGLLLGLATREEADDGESGHDGSLKGTHGKPSDLLGGAAVSALGAGGDHVGLEHESLDEKILIEESLHDGRENALGDGGADADVMGTILQDFGLDDGHETVLLTDGAVAGKRVSGLTDSQLGGKAVTNLEDSSPFGEAAAQLVVLGASLAEAIETLSGGLLLGATNNLQASVDLDTAVDASAAEQVTEALAILARVLDGLVEHDNTADVLLKLRSREEQLTVGLAVLVRVLNVDAIETLADGAGGLVGSEDTLAGSANLLGGFDEFFLEFSRCVQHN